MVLRGSKKGATRFSIGPRGDVKAVFLAGDFTGWQPVRMRRQRNGTFVLIVPLDVGEYQYKFIVNGEWVTDPDNDAYAPNPYGTFNSVVGVASPRKTRRGDRRGDALRSAEAVVASA